MDTSNGELQMGLGHLEDPELTVTLDYATAKAILVDGNPQAGMQAFMAGKVKVQGDMTKLMAMQSQAPDPVAQQVADRVKEITEYRSPPPPRHPMRRLGGCCAGTRRSSARARKRLPPPGRRRGTTPPR